MFEEDDEIPMIVGSSYMKSRLKATNSSYYGNIDPRNLMEYYGQYYAHKDSTKVNTQIKSFNV